MRNAKEIKEHLVNQLSGTFPDADKRVAVWAETDKYHWKEDQSVWNQKKGNTAPQYEAYMDGEFVCFIDTSKGTQYNVIEFLENIKKLYSSGKIFVHKEMYEIKAAEMKAKTDKQNEVIVPKATTPEEKMIVHVLDKAAKKRGKKVVQK